jgi:outer membrane protein assembly factor BamB
MLIRPPSPPISFLILSLSFLTGTSQLWAFEEIVGDARQEEQLPPVMPKSSDWPWWRGPNLNGIAQGQNLPIEFGPDKNVRWRVKVAGRGHSSPIVWGERLFLTSADEDLHQQRLHAFDRHSGRALWTTTVHSGKFTENIHRQNSQASPSCACDGERVFTVFVNDGRLWTSAFDYNGKLLWQTAVGNFDSIYGHGSSPAIYQSLVIVCGDNDQGDSYLAAVHRKSGKIVWRIERPKIDTYGTPIVPRVAGRDQLLLAGCGYLASYDPNTGREQWRCKGPTTETTANTVAFSDDCVFASGGYPKPYTMISVRADGQGDVTDTHLLWEVTQRMPYVPSPLYHDGLLYIADDWGIFTCTDAATGKAVWTKRLGGDITSSPVLVGNRIYVANEQGTVFVLKAGRRYERLATNDLAEGIMATPTILGDSIYLRTAEHLYCFAESGN